MTSHRSRFISTWRSSSATVSSSQTRSGSLSTACKTIGTSLLRKLQWFWSSCVRQGTQFYISKTWRRTKRGPSLTTCGKWQKLLMPMQATHLSKISLSSNQGISGQRMQDAPSNCSRHKVTASWSSITQQSTINLTSWPSKNSCSVSRRHSRLMRSTPVKFCRCRKFWRSWFMTLTQIMRTNALQEKVLLRCPVVARSKLN